MSLIDQILIAFFTALATAALAYIGFWRQAKAELQKEYQSRFNEKKWESYSSFVRIVPTLIEINRIIEIKSYGPLSLEDQKRLDEFPLIYKDSIEKIESEILLVGSKKVVKLFLEWEGITEMFNAKDEYTIEIFIPLLNSMREDLGLEKSDFTLDELDGKYFISKKKWNSYYEQGIFKKSDEDKEKSSIQQQQ
jgi:hypothetical protein